MLALLACLLLLPGAYSIEVSFSAQDGGGSVGLSSIYNLDDSASASEGASASFGQVGITDTRSVSGTGNLQADQRYSGSGGYSGAASFHSDGSGTMTGSASLNPQSMCSSQVASVSGSGFSRLNVVDPNGNFASVYADTIEGSLSASQNAWTGSAHASSMVHSSGKSVAVEALASDPLHESDAYSELNSNGIVSARFDGTANAYAGHSTDAEILSHIQGGLYSFVGAGTLQAPDSVSRRDYTDEMVNADQHLHAHTSSPGVSTDDLTFYAGGPFKIQAAIDVAHSGETINVNPGVYYENPVIDKNLILKGAGADKTIVDGSKPIASSAASVFTVNPGVNAQLSGMTIQGGKGTNDPFWNAYLGGGIEFVGGGIYNLGTLTVDSCAINGNSAKIGGGIYNGGNSFIIGENDATITVTDSTISGNSATVYGGGIDNEGTATVTGGTIISGNSATLFGGGGIENDGTATVTGGTIISHNTATVNGGGLDNYATGTATVTGSTISGNSAKWGGGLEITAEQPLTVAPSSAATRQFSAEE